MYIPSWEEIWGTKVEKGPEETGKAFPRGSLPVFSPRWPQGRGGVAPGPYSFMPVFCRHGVISGSAKGVQREVCVWGGGSRLPRTESGVEVCGRFGFDPSPPRKARRSGSKGWRGRLPFRKEGGASRRAQGARKPALAGADLGFEAERAG